MLEDEQDVNEHVSFLGTRFGRHLERKSTFAVLRCSGGNMEMMDRKLKEGGRQWNGDMIGDSPS